MYPATGILEQWHQVVDYASPRNPAVADIEAQLTEARSTIKSLTAKNNQLQQKVTASVTVIAELHS